MTLSAPRARLLIEWWLILLCLSALVSLLVVKRTAARLDDIVYDHLLRLDRQPPSPEILLVAIDNHSLREIGPWPWPRDVHARLLRALGRAGPRAIAYDVLFVDPGDGAADQRLGAATGGSGAPAFVPLLFDMPGRNGAPFDAVEPIAPVRAAARGIGHVNLMLDEDGIVRRLRPWQGDGRRRWPHLMDLVRRSVQGVPGAPPPGDEPMLIPFGGPSGHFPTVPAASVLKGEVPAELMRNRLILVGTTADGLGDRYPTAWGDRSGMMPGVEIQAHLLDGLLTGRMIAPAGTAATILFALAPLWGLMLAFRRLRPRSTLLLLGLSGAAVLLVTGAALLLARIWLPPGAGLIGLAIAYPLWNWRRLQALGTYMTRELEQFNAMPDLLPRATGKAPAADPISAQALLLEDAIRRMRDMRRFVSDRLLQLPDATLVTDFEGKLLIANIAAEALLDSLGVPLAERGNVAGLLHRLRPGREDRVLTLPATTTGGEDHQDHEVTSPDGRVFSLRFAPQYSGAGASIGWVIRLIDISESRAIQRQREDILQLLTHDMRSPQASILAVIETAAPGEISKTIAGRIEDYARRTLGLADGFVQLSRAESLHYVTEEINLSDLLVEAIDDLWPQLVARRMVVETRGEEEELLVRGERSLLTRAMVNVIGNAIKYSDAGSRITCTLGTEDTAQGMLATCAVTDEGPGLAPQQMEMIFKRFHRAPAGIGRKVDGVGLGLSFVHTVMARHHGEIRCRSEPGRGATFTLVLPLIK